MRYCISDLHGHWDKYRAMLELISLKKTDTLFVLGDVIDRGPDGVRILRDMMGRSNVIPLLGNHEITAVVCLPWLMEEVSDQSLAALNETQIAALSEWIGNGGGPTLRALRALSMEEREDLLDYLRDMDVYAEVRTGRQNYLLVHAGLDRFVPGKPLDDYDLQDFLFARPIPGTTYGSDWTLIFGHTPTRLLWEEAGQEARDEIFRSGGMIGIDCGCGFGGRLGCLCLETMDEFYV